MRIEELLTRAEAPEPHDGVPAWMVTFADLSILLLTFFVVLFSFANMDARKFRDVLGSVRGAFGSQQRVLPGSPSPALPRAVPSALPMERAPGVIGSVFQDLDGLAELVAEGETVTVRVDGQVLFPSGSAELNPGADPVLDRVLVLLQTYTFDLHILGHTDSVPIETAQFPSNWELSSARAAAALRYLLARGIDPQRLVAVGFADSRPVAPQATPEGRARNRRVEFVFRASEPSAGGAFGSTRAEPAPP